MRICENNKYSSTLHLERVRLRMMCNNQERKFRAVSKNCQRTSSTQKGSTLWKKWNTTKERKNVRQVGRWFGSGLGSWTRLTPRLPMFRRRTRLECSAQSTFAWMCNFSRFPRCPEHAEESVRPGRWHVARWQPAILQRPFGFSRSAKRQLLTPTKFFLPGWK